ASSDSKNCCALSAGSLSVVCSSGTSTDLGTVGARLLSCSAANSSMTGGGGSGDGSGAGLLSRFDAGSPGCFCVVVPVLEQAAISNKSSDAVVKNATGSGARGGV